MNARKSMGLETAWGTPFGTSILRWGIALALFVAGRAAPGAEPVALWVESIPVPPSSQPLVNVRVKNLLPEPYEGILAVRAPEGWRIAPARREISLEPGEVKRVAFNVEKGVTLEANTYPLEVSATGAGTTVVRKQNVFCASAPYFKPTIDGDPAEWNDAIPVSFVAGGKKTVIHTYWNRRALSLLVAVEEERLIPYQEPIPAAGIDAVQVALSPQDSTTGTSTEEPAERFEFLLVATEDSARGTCFRLAEPETKLKEAQTSRPLAGLEYAEAEVAVVRTGGVTYYECSLPFAPIRNRIRPSEGREFYLSILVHDPDGTGLRDLGEAAGLWPDERSVYAWSRWQGARWPAQPAYDNKIPWGLCASKY